MLRCSLSAVALVLAAAPLRAGTINVPADFETIQAGIDAAVTGDIVQVSKGVYSENVVIVTAGITLRGRSAAINGRYLGNCITVTANDVTIDSLTLANGVGGLLATGTGITADKLTVVACSDFGIRLIGTGTVTSCKVDACLSDGINVSTGNPLGSTLTVISRNTVTRCGIGIRADDGPFTVDKNTCEQNSGDGIEVNITGSAAGTTVTKNRSNNNGETGIIVSQPQVVAPLVLFEKNSMDANGSGCLLEGFSIDAMSNAIQNSIGDGLLVEASNCNVEKNRVQGNGGRGIEVEGNENTVPRNTVQDNGADGINVSGDTNILDSNTVKDSKGDGSRSRRAPTATRSAATGSAAACTTASTTRACSRSS
jgi:parallel beta-helix repeat protein